MRVALLTILACLFLVAPPGTRPIVALCVSFVMSAALLEMLGNAKRATQRRGMLNAQFRDHAAALASVRKFNARRLGSFTGCFI